MTWLDYIQILFGGYILIGAIVILYEWICCTMAHGSIWGSDKTKDHIIELLAYMYEILIWPKQIAIMIKSAKRLLTSPQWREYMEHLNEEEP